MERKSSAGFARLGLRFAPPPAPQLGSSAHLARHSAKERKRNANCTNSTGSSMHSKATTFDCLGFPCNDACCTFGADIRPEERERLIQEGLATHVDFTGPRKDANGRLLYRTRLGPRGCIFLLPSRGCRLHKSGNKPATCQSFPHDQAEAEAMFREGALPCYRILNWKEVKMEFNQVTTAQPSQSRGADGLASTNLLRFAGLCVLLVLSLALAVYAVLHTSLTGQNGSPLVATVSSLIALLFSAYTLVRQRYAAEMVSWNTALTRLGHVYDQAVQNDELAPLIEEHVDFDGKQLAHVPHLTPKQNVWLANLFMAFEQIYIAVSGASRESQRAWQRFLRNQLNKPTIRAIFIRDVEYFSDYHQGFIEFACGKRVTVDGKVKYLGGAIKAEVLSAALASAQLTSSQEEEHADLTSRPLAKHDLTFWHQMYSDPEVKRQMYARPIETDEALFRYLCQEETAYAFTVVRESQLIGGFTIRKETDTRGTFGVLIHKDFRGRGLGVQVMKLLEQSARELGLLTLRADVYEDNLPSIRLLEKCGFRRFIWLEKNLK